LFDQRNPGYTNKAPAWCIFGAAHWESDKGVFGGGRIYPASPVGDPRIVGPDGEQAPEWLVAAS